MKAVVLVEPGFLRAVLRLDPMSEIFSVVERSRSVSSGR
jgi:hypothetical protein